MSITAHRTRTAAILSILLLATVGLMFAVAPRLATAQVGASGFSYRFEYEDDRNYDLWPDDWSRRVGSGFPRYVKIGIEPRPTAAAGGDSETEANEGNCIQIELNGGAAELTSPARKIDKRFSYFLEFEVSTFETERGENNEAWVTVEYRNGEQRLASYRSDPVSHAADFQKIRIGPMIPPDVSDCQVVVKLHVAPTKSTDLFGGARFDEIQFLAYPKLLITTNQPYNVFPIEKKPEISCQISGVEDENASLSFQLFDASNRPVGVAERRSLVDSLVELDDETQTTPDDDEGLDYRSLLDELNQGSPAHDLKREVTVRWAPPIPDMGFYRLQIQLLVGDEPRMTRHLSLAVVDTSYARADAHFGWTMPEQDVSTSLPQLTELIRQSGIHWVKYPVWYADSDHASAEWIAEFAERLAGSEIELVGMLVGVPDEHRDGFSQPGHGIASLLREPESWGPAVNHVLTRLSLKVHRWQLGADDDLSLVGYTELKDKLKELRELLARYAKDMRVGITWHWLHFDPSTERLPWDFTMNVVEPAMTSDELTSYLEFAGSNVRNAWTTIQPLPRDGYHQRTRIRDLVARMAAIKIAGANGFVSEPFSSESGLLQDDGTPSELYVPFRTTSFELAGKTYLGSIQLPQGSRNFIFEDGETATMLVWNDKPVQEVLYLGDEVRVTDIWGRKSIPATDGHRQKLEIDDLPVFVSGLDPEVARYRMNFQFDRKTLASIFGQRQQAAIKMTNVFTRGISGNLEIVSEELWQRPIEISFKAGVDEAVSREFPIILLPFASTGKHQVRADVVLDTDRRYQFSVFRELQVGYGRVALEHRLSERENGFVVVHATLVNNSFDQINFECMLIVPGQRRQRKQILRLGHGRETVDFFISPNAEVGDSDIWLRGEEIRGNRVLNHHFKIVPQGVANP